MVQIPAPDSSIGRALTKDSEGLGSNPFRVIIIFCIPLHLTPTGTYRLTPSREEPGVIFENGGGGVCDGQTGSNTGAR